MDGETNFDRLKEMSAEDFAVWIGTVAEGCDFCPHHHDCLYDDKYSEQCEALWLRWLNSPAELTCFNKSNDMISKRKVLEALEHERERLLALKMYGAEDVLVHHAIRVIEEL